MRNAEWEDEGPLATGFSGKALWKATGTCRGGTPWRAVVLMTCWGAPMAMCPAETTWASISGLTEVKMLLQVSGADAHC